MAETYKLSHTAQEIDEKLKKVEEGGVGYTDGETIHPIDPKFLPNTVATKSDIFGAMEASY